MSRRTRSSHEFYIQRVLNVIGPLKIGCYSATHLTVKVTESSFSRKSD